MQIVYVETTRADSSEDDFHREVVTEMRRLAERIEGFSLWRHVDDGLMFWGVVMFETEAAALSWKSHPDHAAIYARTKGKLYTSFWTQAFESVRENSFGQD